MIEDFIQHVYRDNSPAAAIGELGSSRALIPSESKDPEEKTPEVSPSAGSDYVFGSPRLSFGGGSRTSSPTLLMGLADEPDEGFIPNPNPELFQLMRVRDDPRRLFEDAMDDHELVLDSFDPDANHPVEDLSLRAVTPAPEMVNVDQLRRVFPRGAHTRFPESDVESRMLSRVWKSFVQRSTISAVMWFVHRMSLPLAKTSKSLLVRNGDALFRITDQGVKTQLLLALLLIPGVRAQFTGEQVEFAGSLLQGAWTAAAQHYLLQVVFPSMAIMCALVLLLAGVGFLIYGALQFVGVVGGAVNRAVKSIARAAVCFYDDHISFEAVKTPPTETEIAMMYHEKSVHYLRNAKGERVTYVSYTSSNTPALPHWDGAKQEQAVAGSTTHPVKEIPPWLCLIYVEKIYVGCGFFMSNVLVTASHVVMGAQIGSQISIRTKKGVHSWIRKEHKDVLPTNYGQIVTTPFPDVSVIPLHQSDLTRLGVKNVVAKWAPYGMPMTVTTIGTTSVDSESHLWLAQGVTNKKKEGGMMTYSSSTFNGFSGSPVMVAGTEQDTNPKVVAVHQGAASNSRLNQGFSLWPVATWLNSFRKAEDSDTYFYKMVEDYWNELRECQENGTDWMYLANDGNYWFTSERTGKTFRMSEDEWNSFQDASDPTEFRELCQKHEEEEDAPATHYSDQATRAAERKAEEEEELKGNDNIRNDADLSFDGESAQGAAKYVSSDEESEADDGEHLDGALPAAQQESAKQQAGMNEQLRQMSEKLQRTQAALAHTEEKLAEREAKPVTVSQETIEETISRLMAKAQAAKDNELKQLQQELIAKAAKLEEYEAKARAAVMQLEQVRLRDQKLEEEKKALQKEAEEKALKAAADHLVKEPSAEKPAVKAAEAESSKKAPTQENADGFTKVDTPPFKWLKNCAAAHYNNKWADLSDAEKTKVAQWMKENRPEVAKEAKKLRASAKKKPKAAAKAENAKEIEKQVELKVKLATMEKELKDAQRALERKQLSTVECPLKKCDEKECPYWHPAPNVAPESSAPSFLQAFAKSGERQTPATGSK